MNFVAAVCLCVEMINTKWYWQRLPLMWLCCLLQRCSLAAHRPLRWWVCFSHQFPSLIPSVIEVVSFGESRSPQNRHHINKLVPPKIQFNSHTLGGAAFLRSKRFNWKKKTEMLNEFDSLIPIRPYIIASIDAVNKTVQWNK